MKTKLYMRLALKIHTPVPRPAARLSRSDPAAADRAGVVEVVVEAAGAAADEEAELSVVRQFLTPLNRF